MYCWPGSWEGSDDLLSQLFDLVEGSNAGRGFSEPTKVDQTVVVETPKAAPFSETGDKTLNLEVEAPSEPVEELSVEAQIAQASHTEPTALNEQSLFDEGADRTQQFVAEPTQMLDEASALSASPESIAGQLIDAALS